MYSVTEGEKHACTGQRSLLLRFLQCLVSRIRSRPLPCWKLTEDTGAASPTFAFFSYDCVRVARTASIGTAARWQAKQFVSFDTIPFCVFSFASPGFGIRNRLVVFYAHADVQHEQVSPFGWCTSSWCRPVPLHCHVYTTSAQEYVIAAQEMCQSRIRPPVSQRRSKLRAVRTSRLASCCLPPHTRLGYIEIFKSSNKGIAEPSFPSFRPLVNQEAKQ